MSEYRVANPGICTARAAALARGGYCPRPAYRPRARRPSPAARAAASVARGPSASPPRLAGDRRVRACSGGRSPTCAACRNLVPCRRRVPFAGSAQAVPAAPLGSLLQRKLQQPGRGPRPTRAAALGSDPRPELPARRAGASGSLAGDARRRPRPSCLRKKGMRAGKGAVGPFAFIQTPRACVRRPGGWARARPASIARAATPRRYCKPRVKGEMNAGLLPAPLTRGFVAPPAALMAPWRAPAAVPPGGALRPESLPCRRRGSLRGGYCGPGPKGAHSGPPWPPPRCGRMAPPRSEGCWL